MHAILVLPETEVAVPTVWQTGSFTYNGYELVYDSYGTGDQVVVYLHGLLLDADLNRGLAEALARRGHRVVLLDLLGHGRSEKPAHASAYGMDTYAKQVFGLLDHLGVQRAVIGGVSLGANVSLFAATLAPERVEGLILEMPVLERAVPAAAMTFVPLLLLLHYAAPVVGVGGRLIRRIPRIPFGPLNSAVHTLALPPQSMAAVLHGLLFGPVAPTQEQRAGITVSTLVLSHRYDLIHPFDDASTLVHLLPNARLVRARSVLELRLQPHRLTDEIAQFLDDIWTPHQRIVRRA
jgi:pimeloyl-ACP methyl ester carboxylesterase